MQPRDPKNLLYGARRRGPGPKPVDMEERHIKRLEELLVAYASGMEVGGIDPKDYTLELESTSLTEIIVSLHNHRRNYAVQITVEPFLDGDKPTFPLRCKVEPLFFDDDKGRWYVANEEPGSALVKDSSDIFIDCDDIAAAGMTEIALQGAIVPAIAKL